VIQVRKLPNQKGDIYKCYKLVLGQQHIYFKNGIVKAKMGWMGTLIQVLIPTTFYCISHIQSSTVTSTNIHPSSISVFIHTWLIWI
jgi:hypothetical protein